jgi:predicted RNA-binding protein with PIN domain
MIYIIDANNLAGKFKLLQEKDFDRKLIGMINDWIGEKKHKIYLVFDGVEVMGDRYKADKINVVRAPKDSHYRSADDKIVEMAVDLAESSSEEIILVTDDIELIGKVEDEKILKRFMKQVSFDKASDFAEKIKYILEHGQEADDKDMADDAVDKINDELLKLWK